MSTLYLDAFSGISGDMFLGALLDLGVPHSHLCREISKLPLDSWEIDADTAVEGAIRGFRVRVRTGSDSPQPHRNLRDIEEIVSESQLDGWVVENALSVFRRLAQAEAKVHGTTPEQVHFHEVGAVDAIVDIVGVCVSLRYLDVTEVYCSRLPLGSGFVKTAHGILPVPAPATLELLTDCGAIVIPGKGEGEMVTPTGAALVAHLARFSAEVPIAITKVGYGFGKRKQEWPNALRALLDDRDQESEETDQIVLLECNIDDMQPEVYPYITEKLLNLGALDVWTTSVGMKKGRPGTVLSVLTQAESEREIAECVLAETTTLGVRRTTWQRYKAGRAIERVDTVYGSVRLKIKRLRSGGMDAAPEYEDCAKLAREHDVPLRHVYDVAREVYTRERTAIHRSQGG